MTLFASGDSITSAELVPCTPRALRLDKAVRDPIPHPMLMLDEVCERADQFDILHLHILPGFSDIPDRPRPGDHHTPWQTGDETYFSEAIAPLLKQSDVEFVGGGGIAICG